MIRKGNEVLTDLLNKKQEQLKEIELEVNMLKHFLCSSPYTDVEQKKEIYREFLNDAFKLSK